MGIFDENISDDPKFDDFIREFIHVHDWRTYVPDELISAWNTLTIRERQIVYYMAQIQADNEEWD